MSEPAPAPLKPTLPAALTRRLDAHKESTPQASPAATPAAPAPGTNSRAPANGDPITAAPGDNIVSMSPKTLDPGEQVSISAEELLGDFAEEEEDDAPDANGEPATPTNAEPDNTTPSDIEPPVPGDTQAFSFFGGDDSPTADDPPQGSDDIQSLRQQIEALESRISERPEPVRIDNFEVDLTDSERADYEAHLPVFEKVARAAAAAAAAQVQGQVDALSERFETDVTKITDTVQGTQANAFRQQFYSAIPDADELAKHPQFNGFMNNPIPYSQDTVRSRLEGAVANYDLLTVKNILNDFRAKVEGASPPTGTGRAPDSGVTPPAQPPTVGSPPPSSPQPGSKKILPASKHAQATRLFTQGKMSKSELDKISAIYSKAQAEDRIDWNA